MEDGRLQSGEATRPACWFRRLAETILNEKVRELETASPTHGTRVLPNPNCILVPVACRPVRFGLVATGGITLEQRKFGKVRTPSPVRASGSVEATARR